MNPVKRMTNSLQKITISWAGGNQFPLIRGSMFSRLQEFGVVIHVKQLLSVCTSYVVPSFLELSWSSNTVKGPFKSSFAFICFQVLLDDWLTVFLVSSCKADKYTIQLRTYRLPVATSRGRREVSFVTTDTDCCRHSYFTDFWWPTPLGVVVRLVCKVWISS